METTTLKRDATCHRGTVNRHRIAREILDVLRFHSIGGDQIPSVVSASDDERILRRFNRAAVLTIFFVLAPVRTEID